MLRASAFLALSLLLLGSLTLDGQVSPPPAVQGAPAAAPEIPPPPELERGTLPAANPDDSLYSPDQALLGVSRAQPPPETTTGDVVWAITGFAALLALAYLAGNERFASISARRPFNHFLVTGLPFVLLGIVAGHPRIGVLTSSVLVEIRPMLPLGLGFVGFALGTRFDARLIDFWLKGGAAAVIGTVLLQGGLLVGVLFAARIAMDPVHLLPASFRDMLILAAAGTVTALNAKAMLASRGAAPATVELLEQVLLYEHLTAVMGMMLIAVYFRPQGGIAWQIPGTAWLFVSMGIAVTLGALAFALLSRVPPGPSYMVVLLGVICFVAGMASFFRLSTIAVSFVAGVLLVNLPGQWKPPFQQVLYRLEQPVIYLFLIIVGSLWDFADRQGWLLLALFIPVRLVGKALAATILERGRVLKLDAEERRCLLAPPIGALSIALVVSAQDLYGSSGVRSMVTVIIGGALITELVLYLLMRRRTAAVSAPPQTGSATAFPF